MQQPPKLGHAVVGSSGRGTAMDWGFPAAKSEHEIACIVEQLGEELGVWARPSSGDSVVNAMFEVAELIEDSVVVWLSDEDVLLEVPEVSQAEPRGALDRLKRRPPTATPSTGQDAPTIEFVCRRAIA
ncbi:MAG: hypothetical protein JKY37_34715 [Nannocystaceae bacterium]|nr:hypothetical protein [Nannocystaceae bacterium]